MVVLSISAIILTSSASLSLAKVSRANSAHNKLQRKWAMRTTRNIALKKARKIFMLQQAGEATNIQTELNLAGLDVKVILTDEQTKVNINTLAQIHSTGNMQLILNRLIAQSPLLIRSKLAPSEIGTPYQSLDQIFTGTPDDYLNPSTGKTASDNITCWSDGELNFKTASQPALEALLGNLISASNVKKLSAFGRGNPTATVSQALAACDISKDDAQTASQYLTDKSTCFGAWIILKTATRNYISFHACQLRKDGSIQKKWGTTWP